MSTVTIAGNAMAPAFNDGDHVIADRSFTTLERGDVVIFRYPQDQTKSFVKRVVGLPGDRVEIVHGRVSINGQPLNEPYVIDANRSTETAPAVTIKPDEYFLLGDNRLNSSDSRSWGAVARSLVWGKILGH